MVDPKGEKWVFGDPVILITIKLDNDKITMHHVFG